MSQVSYLFCSGATTVPATTILLNQVGSNSWWRSEKSSTEGWSTHLPCTIEWFAKGRGIERTV